mgnify:CR=1
IPWDSPLTMFRSFSGCSSVSASSLPNLALTAFVHFALWLALLNLSEVQFYWSRTSKYRDRHAQSTLFVIHFF